MIKNKPLLPCAWFFIIIIMLLFLPVSPDCSGSPVFAAGFAPPVLSDEILRSTESLKPFLENIYQQSLDRGIRNYYPFSFALIRESCATLQTGQYDKAVLLSEYAERLSPDLPVATAALAKSRWAQNRLFFYYLVWGRINSFCKQFYELEPLSRLITSALLSLTAAFLLTLALFCLTLMVKYLPLAYHDLKHNFPISMPHRAAAAWALIIFCAPLLCSFSIIWALCYWLLIMFSYQTKQEQKAAFCLIFFFLLIPQLMNSTAMMLVAPQEPLVRTLWAANYGNWHDRDVDYLKKYSQSHPEDTASLFTLGLINKKEGSYNEAELYFEKVLERKPHYWLARINLGNVYCALKKPDLAIEQYQQALERNPASVAAHFNVSRAYLQKFMFTESEAEFMKARHLDSSAVNYLLAIYSENPNRLLIDEPLPRAEIWQQVFSSTPENMLLARQLWDFICRGIPFAWGWTATGAFIICAMLITKNRRFALAKHCTTCGKAFCSRCQRVSAQTRSCTQCMNILGKKEGLDPALKEEKVLAIKKYQDQQKMFTRLFTFSFPGAGFMRKGYLVPGLLCSFLFSLFFIFAVINGFVLEDSWDSLLPPAHGLSLIGLACILLCGAAVMLAANRLQERDMTEETTAAAAAKRSTARKKTIR